MNALILLGLVQLGLVAAFLFILRMLFAMLRAGAPLISLPNWKARPPSPSEDVAGISSSRRDAELANPAAKRPEDNGRNVSFRLPLPGRKLAPARRASDVAASQPTEPGRERNRKLLSISELESTSIRAAAQFPEDYYAQVEARLEELFEAYLAEKLSLSKYLDAIRHEKAKAQAILRNPKVWTAPDMRGEAERAVAAVDWCLDWARGQAASNGGDIAA